MTESTAATPPVTEARYAGWGSRVVAVIIDAIPNVAVFVGLTAAYGTSTASAGSASFQLSGGAAGAYFAFVIFWLIFNLLYLQGTKGQSIGKKILGVAIYKAGTTEPLGAGRTFGRQILHIVDAAPCLLGYLWPLWDKENRTFADMIVSSRAYKV